MGFDFLCVSGMVCTRKLFVMEYKYLYLVGIVAVCVVLILIITAAIVKNKKVESQINIQVDGNMDVPIKVDEFKELKERFFKTFAKEKEMIVSIKDYEITFSKQDLSSIVVRRKNDDSESSAALSSDDYSEMFNQDEENEVELDSESVNDLADVGKEEALKNEIESQVVQQEDENDEDELNDLMTIAGINDNAIHLELTSDDNEEIGNEEYDINEE